MYFEFYIYFDQTDEKVGEFVPNEFEKKLKDLKIGFNSIKRGSKIDFYLKNRVGFGNSECEKVNYLKGKGIQCNII
ncbi:hypothetical protein [Mongoliibacter ruber]|uniref:Uncharacterized protein n=1 Tax=Mongoliibacter ruber TaxID=1750599 RepID=A0A2T0WHZ8_9BACT|nr:hypothetical protein [Mongoliibacter ruber]PRY86343.1 hypothetical protein CLW00_109191 [Mongoliibacter ruber]